MRRNFLALFLISVFTLTAVAATVTATDKKHVAAKKATTKAAAVANTEASKPAAATDETKKAVTNKLCPVSGGPVSEKYRAEYKGQFVYVCCEGCLSEFNKSPETFVAKLS